MTDVEAQERAEEFVAGQLALESTFRAGETQRQLAFPTTEHRRKVKFREARHSAPTSFIICRQAFAILIQDRWEAVGQVEEDATAMHERDVESREARLQ